MDVFIASYSLEPGLRLSSATRKRSMSSALFPETFSPASRKQCLKQATLSFETTSSQSRCKKKEVCMQTRRYMVMFGEWKSFCNEFRRLNFEVERRARCQSFT